MVSALRFFNQITSSADYTDLRLKDVEKSAPNQCSQLMHCCEEVAAEDLGANHHRDILPFVLFGEPWTASHCHLSRLKPAETQQVNRGGVI